MRLLKMLLALAAGPLALGLLPTHASAQVFMQQNAPGQLGQYNPPRTGMGGPAYSPLNNINRPGGAASNYFGTIRPQMDAMRAFNQIQQNQANAAVGPGPVEDPNYLGGQGQLYKDPANLLQTGHPVAFGNTAQYFPVQTGRGVSGAGGAGAGGIGNRGILNQPGYNTGAAVINGNVYGGVVNTPNQSILIGPSGPTVINRLP